MTDLISICEECQDCLEECEEASGVRKHLWTRDEVYRAMEKGVFGGEPLDWLKMELLEGELFEKMPQKRLHTTTAEKSRRVLEKVFGDNHFVQDAKPIQVNQYTEPEPDLAVIAGTLDDYEDHPMGKDARLVVEISDTTLRRDRHTKSRLYAQAGISEYWILILKNRTLEVRRDPAPNPESPQKYEYRSIQTYQETDRVAPLHAPDAFILVADLLPDLKRSKENDDLPRPL